MSPRTLVFVLLGLVAVAGSSLSCRETSPRATRSQKLVVIGFDGLDPDLVRQWAGEGKLPTFARLIDQGGGRVRRRGKGGVRREGPVLVQQVLQRLVAHAQPPRGGRDRKATGWIIKAWLLINQRAIDFEKHPLLHLDPPNMPRDFKLNGQMHKFETLAVITQGRHEELIVRERELDEVKEILKSERSNLTKVIALKKLLGL